jgi:glutathione S-transferase
MEELGLKYETKFLDFQSGEHKAPEYTKFNPNGRKYIIRTPPKFLASQQPPIGIPTIIDHDNNDFTIWESNTIIKYLVDRYDKDSKIHFPFESREYYETDQWMNFQVSGQVRSLLLVT